MRRRRRSAVSRWNVDPLRSTTLRAIRSARSGYDRGVSAPLPTPKVMPRFSLGDVGEARWPLSHRWTDTRRICVALCVEPPLGVRPTLPAARGSSQLAASAESLVTDAERSNRLVTCLLRIISDVTRVRHAQGHLPSRSSVRSLLVLLLYKQRCLSCLARPVWGTIGRAEAFCLGQMLGAL